MAPSIKTLKAAFPKLSPEEVKSIRRAMAPGAHVGRHAMRVIDEILGTHGVEYIPAGHNAKSPGINYCNTGDSYGTTVLLVRGKFRVGSWADIVERGNYD